ncbi:cyclin-A2 [Microtus ochrogaster]|uniref:Cyclin-A2 n=1 Tax=Microtus ochrogaster TaxID=79684 RepID=A0ABM0LPZ9_MICOH|nr:cyclin-A2 [Microtus ochrogaster]
MPGSSRSSAREAGSALLSLQQEDQENVNPEKVAPAQQPRAQIALKAGNARGNAPQQRFKTRRVAPLKDLSVNDEHVAVGPSWKANSKQPAFTIHVDEEEETQKRPAEHKETQCEDALAFNAAVSLPGARKPLVPLDYPMDGSFGKGYAYRAGTYGDRRKFEEIYPPEVAEFVYITDDTYSKKQVLRMEHLVLKVLAFDLAAPTVNQFLTQYFLHQQPANCKVESLAMFLGELSLIDADPYLKYLPSLIAGAAFHLALYTVTGQSWPESLVQKTGYTLESLKPCLMDLYQTYLRAPQHAQQSIREKYKHSKYHGVSLLNPPETLNV